MENKEEDLKKQEEQEKELQEEIEKFKKLEEETDEMIEEEKQDEVEKVEEEEEKEPEEKELDEEEKESDEVDEKEPEEEKKEDSEVDKSTNKARKIFIAILIVIILLLIFSIVIKKYNNKHTKSDDLVTVTDMKKESKEVMDIDKSKNVTKQDEIKQEQKKKSYTKNYQKHEKLTKEEKKKTEVIPNKDTVPTDKLDTIEEYDNNDESSLPKKFNLKDKIKLKVEDQENYGLCWDFASNNSIETNYQLSKNKELDLSEIYVDYMASNYLFEYRFPHDGGYFDYVSYISDYFGLAKEEEKEYKDYSLDEVYDFLDREHNIYIDNSIDLPTVYKEDNKAYGNYDELSDEELDSFRNDVKYHIMNYGSLYALVNACGDKNCYSSGTDEDEWVDHAISVVGWDDTYSKNNFKARNGSKPSHDGAYIILNSWGDGVGDKGYQYYSYDDAYIESNMVGVLSVTDTKENFIDVDTLSSNMKKIINRHFSKKITKYNGKNVINPNAFKNVNSLDLSNMNLTNEDLRDIVKYFPDLYNIDLKNNKLTNVSVLDELYGLNYLDLTNNNVKDVSSLKNTEIDTLILDGNSGVSGYSKLTTLTYLSLKNCNITNLENISSFELYGLSVSNNGLSSVSGINDMSIIELNNNAISNVDFLKDKNIGYIDLSYNNLTSTSGLNDVKVNELILDNNNISELDLTSDDLGYLSAASNKITKTATNDNVYNLNLSKNNLNDYDLIKNYPKVEFLTLDNNNISTLKGISDFKELSMLSLIGNKISDIDDYSKDVYYLDLKKNNIKSIDGISKFKKLKYINLTSNEVSDISELNKLDELSNIEIGNNKINDLGAISDSISDLDEVYLSLEGTNDVTGKVGSNIEGLNLTNCSVKDIDLNSDDLYALNIEKLKGDFDLYKFIEDKDNYYVIGTGQKITEKEYNKYLETYYKILDEEDYLDYLYESTSGDEDEDDEDILDDDELLLDDDEEFILNENDFISYASVYLTDFNVDYKLAQNNGVYNLTNKNLRRFMTNNYLLIDAPNIKFTDKFDGFTVTETNNAFDLVLKGNNIKFISE